MLALVAGRGHLPELVAARHPDALICALAVQPPERLKPTLEVRLETLGSFLEELKSRGVTEVCFCGAIDRPSFDPARLDAATVPLVAPLRDALSKGDDGALRVVIGLFEAAGFAVRGAHELIPDLLMPPRVPTRCKPGTRHEADAIAGRAALARMGAEDMGQACVVREARVLARETEAGTDALLAQFAAGDDPPSDLWQGAGADLGPAARDWLERLKTAPGAGAVLVKGPKPGQERRADLPTIGPGTALGAARAGFDGIVIEADGVIVVEPARVLALLDAAGLFLWAREP